MKKGKGKREGGNTMSNIHKCTCITVQILNPHTPGSLQVKEG